MVGRGWIVGLLVAGLIGLSGSPVAADEIDRRVERLEREVAALRAELERAVQDGDRPARLDEIDRRIDILAAELESLHTGQPTAGADQSTHGLGPAASKVYRAGRGVSVGGYGEMLYQNFDPSLENGAPNDAQDTLDLLRAVLYFGYKFDDRFLFNSEIEFEHASTEDDGEVSVEFAYVDYLWREPVNVRAGLVLLPLGFLNELHEPTVFLGTIRPETERRILPTTWREGGIGIFGGVGPVSYRTYVVGGLDASGFGAEGLRDGRQNGSEAKADDFAWTGRLDYVGTPGLVAGASAYLGKSGQGLEDAQGAIDPRTSIFEAHLDGRWRGFELRLLAARAEVDDVTRLNGALGLTGGASVGEALAGGYVQAGYDVLAGHDGAARLVPFVRWETLNTQDEVPAGFLADPETDVEVRTFGLAYQPILQLVVKVDYRDMTNGADTGYRQLNASFGYVF